MTDLRQTQDKIATTLDEVLNQQLTIVSHLYDIKMAQYDQLHSLNDVKKICDEIKEEQRALAHIQERTLAALERIAKCQETILRLESLKVTHNQSSLVEWRSKIVDTVNNALVTNGTDRAEEK
ncbi:MAG: hypothetical protein KGJ13_02090 [Patescibacteria group bacterium]|nr:hypothetical protein [Patescibacteria group bacterium]